MPIGNILQYIKSGLVSFMPNNPSLASLTLNHSPLTCSKSSASCGPEAGTPVLNGIGGPADRSLSRFLPALSGHPCDIAVYPRRHWAAEP
jgi:hypothetical protein